MSILAAAHDSRPGGSDFTETRFRALSAGDFDYDRHGHGYTAQRRTDPRIAALVHRALGDAQTVLNVGAGAGFWLADYVPELLEHERRRMPSIGAICSGLGPQTEVQTVPVPFDCLDGFSEAFYGRPERFLDHEVRRAQSFWGFAAPGVEDRFVASLRADLASGEWDERYGALRSLPSYVGALRLIRATRDRRS